MKRALPPPIVGRREPDRSEWVAQLEPRRWYEHTVAWIGLAVLATAALVAYVNLG